MYKVLLPANKDTNNNKLNIKIDIKNNKIKYSVTDQAVNQTHTQILIILYI
ncbi:hypothetical protein DYBT9275_03199 [Dyadobacter sp. CECT 9275]|uniref:Uncharacterized protein n=1 Tax=Dyadobacter helix TaxID=2822344 RepID=A0A916JE19_9BACT|nr:hypothetical protein DYBT9275_03199 [Dyadobacter sp. CECT 9275]